MDNWVPWVALVLLTATLCVASTLNLSLRLPSRVRMAEQLQRAGRSNGMEKLVAARARYMLVTAVIRSGAVVGLFVAVLYDLGLAGRDQGLFETTMACLLAWVLVLVFGVAIPHAWSKYAGEWLVVRLLPLLAVLHWVGYPLIVLLELFDPLVRRLAGVPVQDAKSFANELEREILDVVSEGELHGAVDEEEKEMIESVMELGDTRVEEIMTPRTEIVALPQNATLDQVLQMIRSKGYSRIPVYGGNIDRILGVLYAKDLLRRAEESPLDLEGLMRKPLYIPESKPVRELLREFQERKVHIAIVLDEYGGTAGLVTIEDILEELVGEIADEYETQAPAELNRIDEHTIEVDARMRIDDLNDRLDIRLPEDGDYETIGGFVFSALGKIPKVGEQFNHQNIGIRVIAAEPRRITRLRLTVHPSNESS